MSDPSVSSAWPASRRSDFDAIRHPAWEEARNAVLDLAAEGPVTVALVGAAGVGKTWLLRELAGCLDDHGFPTMELLQGDLPIALSDGAALLVDEASRMGGGDLGMVAAQGSSVVVLADLAGFADRVAALPGEAVVIPLRLLTPDEVGTFAAEWLRRAGVSPTVLEAAGLSRVIHHAEGTVRLVVHLLGAAVATRRGAGEVTISAADIDRVAQYRLGGMEAPPEADEPEIPELQPEPEPEPEQEPEPVLAPVVQAPAFELASPAPARRRAGLRVAGVAAALAACLAGVWLLRTAPPAEIVRAAATPPLRAADVARPMLADSVLPPSAPAAVADLVTPPPAPAPDPLAPDPLAPDPLASDPLALATAEPASALAGVADEPETVRAADVTPPPDPVAALPAASPGRLPTTATATVGRPEPLAAQTIAPPLAAQTIAPPSAAQTIAPPSAAQAFAPPSAAQAFAPPSAAQAFAPPSAALAAVPLAAPLTARQRRPGGPGLILLVKQGDTLESMYQSIYRDRTPPPYDEVVAANPRPLKPGALVVFPEPLGGWSAAQR